MSRPLLALAAVLLAAASSAGQDRPMTPPAAPAKVDRVLHGVQFLDAAELAKVLSTSFRGEVSVAVAPGNTLLVSGPHDSVTELLSLARQLDAPPRTVAVELTLVEVSGKKGDEEKEPAAPDLAGPAADLAGKLAALAKANPSTSVRRIALTATAGQPVSTTLGGNVPLVTSSVLGGRGGAGGPPVQRSISYSQVGTTAAVTARPEGNGVAVELMIQDTRVRAREGGDENAPAEMVSHTLKGPVRVPAGRAIVAQTCRTDGKAGPATIYVVVTARAVEPSGRSGR